MINLFKKWFGRSKENPEQIEETRLQQPNENYPHYITYVIVDYIFKNPPSCPNYKELENIGKQMGVPDLANKAKFFLSSFYKMDVVEIRTSLLNIGMPIEEINETIHLLRK